MKYSTVSNPKFSSLDNLSIDCEVFFEHLGETVPFTACKNDTEPHGREIFTRCVAGEFGFVGAYAPPESKVI